MVSASPKPPKTKYLLRLLPVNQLIPTEDNTRRPITQSSVESLARSMARDGVLQPIVVRPHPEKEGHWEIRAGERRWRAAKLAGLKEIPAIIRPLDDDAARTVTIAENLLRENLHPLEEAAGIQQALDRGQDPKQLAGRLGKSLPFILRRAALTRLSKTWKDEVLTRDSEVSRLSVAHLELIARLPAETQDFLAQNEFQRIFARGFPTVGELRRVLDEGLRTLVSMPWKLDDDTIDPKSGACINCPKRSGMQPALFENEDAPKDGKVSPSDRCLDPACFDRRLAAFVLRRETDLRRDHPALRLVQISLEGVGPATVEATMDRVTRLYSPRIVKASDKAGTPAMQISGPKAGSLVHIDFGDRHLNGHAKGNGRAGGAEKKAELSLEDRKARLQKRRDAFVVTKVLETLRGMTPETLTTALGEMAKRTDAAAKHFDALALVLAFGTNTRADREHDQAAWERYDALHNRKQCLPVVTALHEVVQVWTRRLGGSDTHHVTEQATDARRICAILGMDVTALDAEAAREIPTPKSWEALAASGQKTLKKSAPVDSEDEEPPFTPNVSSTPVRSGRSPLKNRPRKQRRPHPRRK